MGNNKRYILILGTVIVSIIIFSSCERFLNPEQAINVTEDRLYDDWYEYRSVGMGLYGLQAELVEQLVVLGELRGDLLQITENADADLVEVYNFNISRDNKYASPAPFFKLIAACNNFIRILEERHPEVTVPGTLTTNFHKLHGEVLCMRAWAYYNAVRIYGKVPFIHESLTTNEEIDSYINSSDTYTDSVHIVFGLDGYTNDTTYNKPITLERKYLDEDQVIDYFTNELETKVNPEAVGVIHYIDNNDNTWEISIWNVHAYHTLLGIMYLTRGDLANAAYHFEEITNKFDDNQRYQIDNTYSNARWKNIFNNLETDEHILAIWFDKGFYQQNRFQEIFDPRPPHKYMLKPTSKTISLWESTFDNMQVNRNDARPYETRTTNAGSPGDFYRGYGVSYTYMRDGVEVPASTLREALNLKLKEDYRTADVLMGEVDTVVWKYSFNKDVYDQDANFIIYRAASVHLWLAEAYVYWKYENDDGVPEVFSNKALKIVNDGSQYSSGSQQGVRGRVGIGGRQNRDDGIYVGNINYSFHPYTNQVVGWSDLTGNFPAKQSYLEELIIDERARELAFEGERFYDLMRVAKKRNDPSFLAKKVSEKFPAERRNEMYNYLLNEENWYINYFE